MNGPSSTKKDDLKNFVTPRQQQIIKQKNERRKFVFALILSNLLTVLLVGHAQSPQQDETEQKIEKDIPRHTRISLAVKLFVPLLSSRQAIGLYNKEGRLIIEKAYLESSKTQSNQASDWQSVNQAQEHLIWVPDSKVSELTRYSQDELMAYPFSKDVANITQSQNNPSQRKSYELTF